MGKENEVKILNIGRKDTIKRLTSLGAKHTGTHKFKRIEFLLDGNVKGSHSWGRVRTDGKETTITLKETRGNGGFTSMNEYEIKTDNFKNTVGIISRIINSKLILYFENERDAYKLGNAYITIDKWPKIPYSLEIEAPTMKDVKKTYKMLKIKGKFVGNASIHKIYELYGLNFSKVMMENKNKLKKLTNG